MISAAVIFLGYYLLNRNATFRESNKSLEENMKEMDIESKKIVTLQTREMDIASRPKLSSDELKHWMRSHGHKDSKK